MAGVFTDALIKSTKRFADVQFVDNTDPDRKDKSFMERLKMLELLPQDKEAAARAAVMAGCAAGALTIVNRLFKKSVNPNGQLVDAPRYIHYDTTLFNNLVALQKYRYLNPGMFGAILEYMDQLVLVSHLLVTGKAYPQVSDPVLSFLSYKQAHDLLTDFCDIVRLRLTPEQAVLCLEIKRKIDAQLDVHQKNIMRKCSKFNVKQVLAAAEAEVDDAMKAYKAGQKHMNTFEMMERAVERMRNFDQ